MHDVMTAKDYLKQTFTLDIEINTLMKTAAVLESKAEKTTTVLDPNKIDSGSLNLHSREDAIVKMIDFKDLIDEKTDKLVDLKKEIFEKIYKINNVEYRTLLILRYINLKSFEQIAVEMCYSYRHITRLHGWALREFEKHVLLCPNEKV